MSSRSVVQIVGTLLLLTGFLACVEPSSPATNEDRDLPDPTDAVVRSPVVTAVEFAPTSELASSQGEATLLLLGFRDEDLDPRGMPSAVDQPSFEWKQPKRKVTWPVESTISLPQDPALRFFAVIDVDDLGRLSPGDHLSAPQLLPQNSDAPMVFKIDRSLTPNTNGTSSVPSPEGSPSPPTSKETPVPAGPDGSRAPISLVCNPRLPFLDRASVLLVGYPPVDGVRGQPEDGKPPADGVRGQPEDGKRPLYLWQSDPLALSWPVLLDVPTPSGVSLFIVLDVDGDGFPSRGDLSTARVDLTPAAARPAVQQFTLDQVWWPAHRPEAPR